MLPSQGLISKSLRWAIITALAMGCLAALAGVAVALYMMLTGCGS
jgi:hypothetical protein